MKFIIVNNSLYSLENVQSVKFDKAHTSKGGIRVNQPYTTYSQSLIIRYFGGEESTILFKGYLSKEALANDLTRIFNEICEKLK